MNLEISIVADKKFRKLTKNKLFRIHKKIIEIKSNPYHYKPLRGDLHGSRRAHIGSYVLLFEVDKDIIRILDYDHHDKIY